MELINVETDLESEIEELRKKIEESTLTSRTTNALLLAQSMRLDMTNPVDAKKVLRHLDSVERYVRTDENE